jgi:hypothetical protein
MAKFFDELNDKLIRFIEKQKMFFVATAAKDGRVNVSPKGYDALKVLSSKRLLWLNLSGSGNETAAHLLDTNRITIMFCAFEDPPLIMRIYGTASCTYFGEPAWNTMSQHFESLPGARQIFDVQIDSIQTSCGFGVPLYDFADQRTKLIEHAAKKSESEKVENWIKKNSLSIDGKPPGIPRSSN